MRLGILGGTFNPIHNAHLQMAAAARDALHLDKVLLVVAADPPHKDVDGHVSAAHRLRMTALAAETEPNVSASDLEIRRGGVSYTVDTLLTLHEQYPDAELFLIVGSDMLLDLPTWRRPDEILRLASIACMPRRGQESTDAAAADKLRTVHGARITMLPAAADKLSSTMLRDRLEAGLPIEGCLPAAVERYCYEHGLYFAPDVRSKQQRLKGMIERERFVHTMGTVRAAAKLAEDCHADPMQAQLAALLHDCAKRLPSAVLEVLSGDDTGIIPVLHAFAGAVVAKNAFGVTDQAVLRAIRLHCTADAGMTVLEQIIYLADVIEPNRTFDGVEALRERVANGLDSAMRMALERTLLLVEQRGYACHPASLRAYEYYQNTEGND